MVVNESEHSEQCKVIEWFDLFARTQGIEPFMLFAIPNGGARNAITGAMLKAEGVRPGVPDLFLAIPAFGFHGLFIEMKKKKTGVLSDAQKHVISRFNDEGYCVVVCHGFDAAKCEIEDYLEGYQAK